MSAPAPAAGPLRARVRAFVPRYAWALAAAGWTGPTVVEAGFWAGAFADDRFVGYGVGWGLTALSAAVGWRLAGRVTSRRACGRAAVIGLLVAAAASPLAVRVWRERNHGSFVLDPLPHRLMGLGWAGPTWGGVALACGGAWGRWVAGDAATLEEGPPT